MARKQIMGVGLLLDGRAVRVVKLNTERMLEMQKRVSNRLTPAAIPGAPPAKPPTDIEMKIEMERETIALCVRAITLQPVKLAIKSRPLADAEKKKFIDAKMPVPEAVDEPDLEATLGPLRDAPNDPRWTVVGEMQLANYAEDNDLSSVNLFDEPAAWVGVLQLIGAAGGTLQASPFAGKLLKTSAGS